MPKQRAILASSSFTVRPTENESALRTQDPHTEEGRVRLVSITRPSWECLGQCMLEEELIQAREMGMEESLGTHRPADLLYLGKHEILIGRK